VCCGSAAVTKWLDMTALGYRRFRCRACGRRFNERSGGVLNRTCLPSDITAFFVFCTLRYRLTLRDLSEIIALRGIEASYEAVRDCEAKLLPGHERRVAQTPPQHGTAIRRELVSTAGLGTSRHCRRWTARKLADWIAEASTPARLRASDSAVISFE
jgi:hypothetical protein